MNAAWAVGAIASGLGIGVGGGLAWILKGTQQSFGFIYSLCGGLILGLVFLEMIPESIKLGGPANLTVAGITGFFLFLFIHRFMDNITIITNSHQKDIFVRTGVILAVSVAIHNFPVGIALGSTIGSEIGGSILTTLVIHNIPEGIIIFTPLFLAGFGLFTWALFTVFITFPTALGSFLGQFSHINMPIIFSFIVNLAIAVIFMVAVKEILAEAMKKSPIWYCLLIGLTGFGLTYLYLVLTE